MKIYFDFRDWWIGYYSGPNHHYICPLPTIVIRWRKRPKVKPYVSNNPEIDRIIQDAYYERIEDMLRPSPLFQQPKRLMTKEDMDKFTESIEIIKINSAELVEEAEKRIMTPKEIRKHPLYGVIPLDPMQDIHEVMHKTMDKVTKDELEAMINPENKEDR